MFIFSNEKLPWLYKVIKLRHILLMEKYVTIKNCEKNGNGEKLYYMKMI